MLFDSSRQRAILEAVRREYAVAYPQRADKIIIQPSYIQVEVLLAANKTNYKLAINQTDAVAAVTTERKLKMNNDFVITHTAWRYKKEAVAARGKGIPQTYANTTVLGADTAAFVMDDFEGAFFNSSMYIKVGSTVYEENFDLSPCRVVPDILQSAATNRSGNKPFDGYRENEPWIKLLGDGDNDVQVNLAQWDGQLIQFAASPFVYGIATFEGFLVAGVR